MAASAPTQPRIMRVNNRHIDNHRTARKPILLLPFSIVVNKLHRSCSVVSDSTTLRTIACQAPLFMEFSRQRKLESVAISSSRGLSRPRDQTCVSPVYPAFQGDYLPLSVQGSPFNELHEIINTLLNVGSVLNDFSEL